jgi:hypothetical protein
MNDINPILEVQGLGGARLLLFQDSLRIEGKGWRAFLFQGTTSNIDVKKLQNRQVL